MLLGVYFNIGIDSYLIDASDSDALTAAYDGSHGWFWRNRGSKAVTITLKATGATRSSE